ncbi:hypothetical protein [Methanobrevibacter arboriphilus]|uniref:Uncharacterized protein n=1 Tax=Methanobrevibacter arboriphilus TaxID=39441 RepID=A0ACA8R3U7_METAZ|nr:hypothetical protein [Methanobrevibacter arboriphilus]BBL62405.1 hypothetical protein MarbSA_14450 [Methanobrevibacter arboriphilus]
MKQVIKDLFKHSDLVDENSEVMNEKEAIIYDKFIEYLDGDFEVTTTYDKIFIELETETQIIISEELIKFLESLELNYNIKIDSNFKNELVTQNNGLFKPPTTNLERKTINKLTILINREL